MIGDILKNVFMGCNRSYSDTFKQCLETVLENEGGFVNHSLDPGGATNMGITKKTYEQWVGREVSIQEIRNLKVEDVIPIYYDRYWKPSKANEMPNGINLNHFDFAVNAGTHQAAISLQRVLRVKVDGIIGPVTLQAVSEANQKRLIDQYTEERLRFYKSLDSYAVFGLGWENRTRKTAAKSRELLNNGEQR